MLPSVALSHSPQLFSISGPVSLLSNLTRGSDDLFSIEVLLENTTPTRERPRVCFVPILPTSLLGYLASSRRDLNGLPRLGRLAVASMVEAFRSDLVFATQLQEARHLLDEVHRSPARR